MTGIPCRQAAIQALHERLGAEQTDAQPQLARPGQQIGQLGGHLVVAADQLAAIDADIGLLANQAGQFGNR